MTELVFETEQTIQNINKLYFENTNTVHRNFAFSKYLQTEMEKYEYCSSIFFFFFYIIIIFCITVRINSNKKREFISISIH